MRKLILILFVISVLLLSGCSQGTTTPYQKPVAPPSSPEVKQTALPAGEVTEPASAPAKDLPELSSEIQGIIDKAATVTSMDYAHSVWEKNTEGFFAHTYLKGDKMKQLIELGSGTFPAGIEYYDTVYINLAEESVIAYCEDDSCEDRNLPISVELSDFVTETPLDVLDDITYGTKVGSAMYDNREVAIVQYERDDGKTVKVYIWTYKGLPLKYEVYDGEEKVKSVEYKSLVYNGVKDIDLVHQALSNN
jgi:hypothetical protein